MKFLFAVILIVATYGAAQADDTTFFKRASGLFHVKSESTSKCIGFFPSHGAIVGGNDNLPDNNLTLVDCDFNAPGFALTLFRDWRYAYNFFNLTSQYVPGFCLSAGDNNLGVVRQCDNNLLRQLHGHRLESRSGGAIAIRKTPNGQDPGECLEVIGSELYFRPCNSGNPNQNFDIVNNTGRWSADQRIVTVGRSFSFKNSGMELDDIIGKQLTTPVVRTVVEKLASDVHIAAGIAVTVIAEVFVQGYERSGNDHRATIGTPVQYKESYLLCSVGASVMNTRCNGAFNVTVHGGAKHDSDTAGFYASVGREAGKSCVRAVDIEMSFVRLDDFERALGICPHLAEKRAGCNVLLSSGDHPPIINSNPAAIQCGN